MIGFFYSPQCYNRRSPFTMPRKGRKLLQRSLDEVKTSQTQEKYYTKESKKSSKKLCLYRNQSTINKALYNIKKECNIPVDKFKFKASYRGSNYLKFIKTLNELKTAILESNLTEKRKDEEIKRILRVVELYGEKKAKKSNKKAKETGLPSRAKSFGDFISQTREGLVCRPTKEGVRRVFDNGVEIGTFKDGNLKNGTRRYQDGRVDKGRFTDRYPYSLEAGTISLPAGITCVVSTGEEGAFKKTIEKLVIKTKKQIQWVMQINSNGKVYLPKGMDVAARGSDGVGLVLDEIDKVKHCSEEQQRYLKSLRRGLAVDYSFINIIESKAKEIEDRLNQGRIIGISGGWINHTVGFILEKEGYTLRVSIVNRGEGLTVVANSNQKKQRCESVVSYRVPIKELQAVLSKIKIMKESEFEESQRIMCEWVKNYEKTKAVDRESRILDIGNCWYGNIKEIAKEMLYRIILKDVQENNAGLKDDHIKKLAKKKFEATYRHINAKTCLKNLMRVYHQKIMEEADEEGVKSSKKPVVELLRLIDIENHDGIHTDKVITIVLEIMQETNPDYTMQTMLSEIKGSVLDPKIERRCDNLNGN